MNKTLRLNLLRIALATVGFAWITQAVATPTAAKPVYPNCSAAEYHQMNFWIGDWDIVDTDTPRGSVQARAHVDPIAQGCAIHELYEQTDGLVGDSILSYDPARKQWQQTWVTNRGSIMMIAGNFKDGALALAGEAHLNDGKTVMQRIYWKAQEQGVREWAVMSKDGGKTWGQAFDVLFRKHQRG
jgi:hypothetical protein